MGGPAAGNFAIIFSVSTAIGIAWGLISALVFKHLDLGHHMATEMTVFMLVSYVPFLCAEALEMSGIVTILFTGMVAKHYTYNNLNGPVSRETATNIIGWLSYFAESIVFFDLGLSFFGLHVKYNFALIGVAIAACLVSRALHVYPLSFFLNLCAKNGPARIPMNKQHMLWFSGLRGAIAYCLSIVFPGPHREEWQCVTMAIVLASVLIMGGSTRFMLEKLEIDFGEKVIQADEPRGKDMLRKESSVSNYSGWSQKLLLFDVTRLTPIFTRQNAQQSDNTGAREVAMTPSGTTATSV